MQKVLIGLLSCCTFGALAAIPRSNTQDQVQSLYKQITNELICIRKDFNGAQHRVCTLLDQVDKMYNVTKNLHQKKQALEFQANNTSASMKKLFEENKTLKADVAMTKQKFELTFKQLEYTHKQLELEKTQVVQRSKEKRILQGKLAQVENEKDSKSLDEKIKEKVADQIKNLAEAQSLSLTSTSAPISPR